MRGSVLDDLKSAARKIVYRDWAEGLDRRFKRESEARIRAIVAQDPSRQLDPATLKTIREYSRERLGSEIYAPALTMFVTFRGKFIEGWIPGNYYLKFVLPSFGAAYPFCSAKTVSRRILVDAPLPDLAYRVNGSWLDRDYRPIEDGRVADVVFRDTGQVIVKADRSSKGKACIKASRAGFQEATTTLGGDLVVQGFIDQHDFFSQFMPESVATLRLTTVKPQGAAADFVGAFLRVGLAGSSHIRSSHAVCIPVESDTGELHDYCALPDWTRSARHPDTGVAFAGRVIPGFHEMTRQVRALHDRVPHVGVVGWDVVLDKAGALQLMEWNTKDPGIKFTEAATGPVFKPYAWENLHRA